MIAASRTSHTKLWHWKLTGNGYKGKMPLNNVNCFLISPVFFCYMRRCLDASCTGKGRGMRQPGGVAGRSKPGSCFTWGLPLLRMAVGSWGGVTEPWWWGKAGEEPPRQHCRGWACSEQGGGGSDRRQNWHRNITPPVALKSQLVSPLSFYLAQ